jgi:E3 ubiquitin ligase SMURF1/2/E3 ubiquitin-protein ligase NEDD4
LHKEIKIFYVGEVAQDAGGLMREWITELTKAMFSEEIGLFKKTRSQHDFTYFPNSKAKYIYETDYLDYFRFAG